MQPLSYLSFGTLPNHNLLESDFKPVMHKQYKKSTFKGHGGLHTSAFFLADLIKYINDVAF